jgi:hypothetical protein
LSLRSEPTTGSFRDALMESKISIKWLSMYYIDESCDKEGE